jgi:hypothetical protein
MKYLCIVFITALASARLALAHEIGPGDVFFTTAGSFDIIETNEYVITNSFVDDDHYQIVLSRKGTYVRSSATFEMNGGRKPYFSAVNSRYYCDQDVLFVTLKTDNPPLADILGPMIETYAFREDTFGYLGTVPDVFEAITPLEKGRDIGFPYIMPQRWLVECEESIGGHKFGLWFTDREPDFRGFDPAFP